LHGPCSLFLPLSGKAFFDENPRNPSAFGGMPAARCFQTPKGLRLKAAGHLYEIFLSYRSRLRPYKGAAFEPGRKTTPLIYVLTLLVSI
jgi:hypothetical protein